MTTRISLPIPTRPGDLPTSMNDAQLLAAGLITGFRSVAVPDAVAAELLADLKRHAHASTQPEIDAETAEQAAATTRMTADRTRRETEFDAAAAAARLHI